MRLLKAHDLVLAVLGSAALGACSSETTSPAEQAATPSLGVSATGNGAPSGAHYTLNIIGVSKEKSPNMTGGDGHRIFVGLGKTGAPINTRINLKEGDYQVVDANGTDGVAEFH